MEEVSGMPRWVKVFLVVALLVAVLGVVAMLLVGGKHGPGRHSAAASALFAASGLPAQLVLA